MRQSSMNVFSFNQKWFADELVALGHRGGERGWDRRDMDVVIEKPGIALEAVLQNCPMDLNPIGLSFMMTVVH